MKKTATLKRLLAFCTVVLAMTIAPSKAIWAQCNAANATEFVSCLNTAPPFSIKITANYSVDLSGQSLAGFTIDVQNRNLTILGAPITVNASTNFTGNGAAGTMTYNGYVFTNSNAQGTYSFSSLNSALTDQPANNNLLKAVNAAVGVLPVTLSSFSGAASEQVKLEWATSAELNNERFIVETSTEGEVFNRIGEIAGAGTSTEAHTYQFTHQTPSAGVNYYRLKQVDFDGTFAYSKVIAINAAGNDKIFVFPNPVTDQLNIQYDQSKGSAALFLFDAMGRKINTTVGGYAGYYETKLPTDLPAGTYWLRVIRSGKVQTMPIVKH
jgi:Secretion system C-terminal sorting domain